MPMQNKELKKGVTKLNRALACAKMKIEDLEKNRKFLKLQPIQKEIVKQFISNANAKKHGER